jgi:SAM-dependent methyltransferase
MSSWQNAYSQDTRALAFATPTWVLARAPWPHGCIPSAAMFWPLIELPKDSKPACPHVVLDFDQNDFASLLGPASFDLVTAIEVIEHVESPIGFLRNIGRLLAPRGVAVITTPNVDSLPARTKFLLTGKIRTMDEFSEPTHTSHIFWDLLRRQFLARAGVHLREHFLFPTNGYQLSRKPIAWTFRIAAATFSGDSIFGDNHILAPETGR